MNVQPTPVEVLPSGFSYEVPADRAMFQFSVFSMNAGGGTIAMQHYLKQNGKIIDARQTVDNVVPFTENGIKSNNNHPAFSNLVVSAGPLEVWYQNESKLNKSIVFGLGEIQQEKGVNNAYKFYQYKGLETTPFFKQLNAGESTKFEINIQAKHGYGNVTEVAPGTLHKTFNANLFVNGTIYNGETEYTYGDGNYRPYDGLVVKANGQTTIKINPVGNRSVFVGLEINAYGQGQTGRVKVLEQNGIGICANHIRISTYVFNYINFNAVEGDLQVLYKMFNNSGVVDLETMSILQPDGTTENVTLPAKLAASLKSNMNYVYWGVGAVGLGALAWYFRKDISKIFK